MQTAVSAGSTPSRQSSPARAVSTSAFVALAFRAAASLASARSASGSLRTAWPPRPSARWTHSFSFPSSFFASASTEKLSSGTASSSGSKLIITSERSAAWSVRYACVGVIELGIAEPVISRYDALRSSSASGSHSSFRGIRARRAFVCLPSFRANFDATRMVERLMLCAGLFSPSSPSSSSSSTSSHWKMNLLSSTFACSFVM